MSRHSKNNTAGAIFTYKEKKMLKNIYGTQSKVLNTESMKKFEQCHICLQTLENPFCCSKGHLFCKDCIMNNLLKQKKKIKKLKRENELLIQRQNEERKHMAELNEQLQREYKKSKNDDFALRQSFKKHNNHLNSALKIDEKDKLRIEENKLKETLQNTEVFDYDNKTQKQRLAQTSFWIGGNVLGADESDMNQASEKGANSLQLAIEQAPKKQEKPIVDSAPKLKIKMICPGDNNHTIRLKDLCRISFKVSDKKFVCKYCEKVLNFQKISALRKCGHVYCTKCLRELPGKRCLCGKVFKKKHIIPLKESESGFGSHNQTEVKVYTRAFMG